MTPLGAGSRIWSLRLSKSINAAWIIKFSPAVGFGAGTAFAGTLGVVVAGVAATGVEEASPNEMVVEAVVEAVEMTEREGDFAGVKICESETAATLRRPTTPGTKRAE